MRAHLADSLLPSRSGHARALIRLTPPIVTDSLGVIAAIEALHEVGVQRLQPVTGSLGADRRR